MEESSPYQGPVDAGEAHLRWIGRFQFMLLGIGGLAWLGRGGRAALVFVVGGLGSLGFWGLHRLSVGRMLQPEARRRWLYVVLLALKLALIALGLRAMMASFPTEALPLTTGILLFVGGILLEAVRLAFGSKSEEG